jgi:hypothetical protein
MADIRHIDVFNGDADGLCALIQLRLAQPIESERVTGIKRDIALLKQVKAGPADRITVLDISLDRNRADLERLLAAGADVFYVDHHFPGESLPTHPSLTALIDESPAVCTSLLLDRHLGGRFRLWAIAAAFGDNLGQVATNLCQEQGLSEADTANLRQLGELLNYNGYGSRLEDLHFHPAALFSALHHFEDPREAHAAAPEFSVLARGYAEDMDHVGALSPVLATPLAAAYHLPDASWSRRVVGVWANALSRQTPDRAHLILCPDGAGTQTVSLRAPRINPHGASAFCRRYPEGGGREAAAGINHLPESLVPGLIEDFARSFS